MIIKTSVKMSLFNIYNSSNVHSGKFLSIFLYLRYKMCWGGTITEFFSFLAKTANPKDTHVSKRNRPDEWKSILKHYHDKQLCHDFFSFCNWFHKQWKSKTIAMMLLFSLSGFFFNFKQSYNNVWQYEGSVVKIETKPWHSKTKQAWQLRCYCAEKKAGGCS